MFKGRFVSEKTELKQIVGVHYLDGKLLLVFDKCKMFYLALPRAFLDKKPEESQEGKFLMNKEFIPYG